MIKRELYCYGSSPMRRLHRRGTGSHFDGQSSNLNISPNKSVSSYSNFWNKSPRAQRSPGKRGTFQLNFSPSRMQKIIQKGIRNVQDTSGTFDMDNYSLTDRDSPLKRMMSPDKRVEPQSFMPGIKEDTGLKFKIMELK